MGQNIGKVVQVIGSTLDAEFQDGHLPEIYNALNLETDVMGETVKIVCEVQQHLAKSYTCDRLASTDGIKRYRYRRHRRSYISSCR